MNHTAQHLEANFDGLVGPTHNYAGLSDGNLASKNNKTKASNPKLAAKEGLKKMKALHDLGMTQGVIAPLARPDIHALRQLGFSGDTGSVLKQAAKHSPALLAACCSASSMWTANAATVSPSSDTQDNKLHFTPANLINKFHRSIEHPQTGQVLKAMFNDDNHFYHHNALPATSYFGDEGAANHTRFCHDYHEQGVGFFVFGESAFDKSLPKPQRFPARQTLEASSAIARTHKLTDDKVVFAQQNPHVIDAGVFHNDVIAVGNRNVMFCHELAFLNKDSVYNNLNDAMQKPLNIIEVPDALVSVQDAVNSYLFNSQLLSLPSGETALVVPKECKQNPHVSEYLQSLITSNLGIDKLLCFDLQQSMQNGGGPACLRLRVVLSPQERMAMNQSVLMSDDLFVTLNHWVDKHYRDSISAQDLQDPSLLTESQCALDELSQILDLGSVYPFQQ
ncbi:succinylarginine dihydrolase [Vibrio sp. UCD-FRSSP16_10]|uniref:N-succinylarginine dihydrolase n=1 Tax=unclassified Vibrio TaxID=2614977 RepID=UPI0007FD28ED|nr:MULTISPECIES: N-succinylarginine dihydrolase [unclassified Vibrio]OBT16981.1 succinylarginine dihydrolase [Vibrio sp. UCD-FRSSP16_30]OBT21972.1 succinylarginine dihydrolase [Vibrio sp. UCD-FRSSP16_10]